jgi:hypothetical protein
LLLALLFTIATAASPAPAKDPLSVAIFEICPALLDGSVKLDDLGAIEARGFRIVPSNKGGSVIVPAGSTDVQINPSEISKSCPVYLPGGAQSTERLSHVLQDKGLKVESLASPIGGTLINSKDPSGNLITTTQVLPGVVITLVVRRLSL